MSDQKKKPTLNNDSKDRAIYSDCLDKVMGWKGGYKEESCVRGAIHGYYHDRQGDKREKQGDHDGAKLERDRAQQQYDKCKPKK